MEEPTAASLLEELRRLFPGEVLDFEVDDYLFAHGSPVLALMYKQLLWPDFRACNDIVVWEGSGIDDDAIRRAYEQYGHDRSVTEKSCNFVEVPELFNRGDMSEELWEQLTRSMMDCWKARLAGLYPDRTFVFEFLAPNDTTGEEMGFWFYQS